MGERPEHLDPVDGLSPFRCVVVEQRDRDMPQLGPGLQQLHDVLGRLVGAENDGRLAPETQADEGLARHRLHDEGDDEGVHHRRDQNAARERVDPFQIVPGDQQAEQHEAGHDALAQPEDRVDPIAGIHAHEMQRDRQCEHADGDAGELCGADLDRPDRTEREPGQVAEEHAELQGDHIGQQNDEPSRAPFPNVAGKAARLNESLC